jgi:hypothetical protein
MATVPAEMTAVAGAILTATQWNTNVRDAINFIITPPFAIIKQSGSQSLTNNTWTTITFDTEEIDRDNMHSTTTNNSRATAQTAGYYQIDAIYAASSNATGGRATRLQVNGANVAGRSTAVMTASNFQTGVVVSGPVYLNVGDYVELQANQLSGGALSTVNLTDTGCILTARWISTA